MVTPLNSPITTTIRLSLLSALVLLSAADRRESGCRRTDLLVEPMERAASLRTRVDLRHAVSEPEIAEASQL
jgi:hypothetical protein